LTDLCRVLSLDDPLCADLDLRFDEVVVQEVSVSSWSRNRLVLKVTLLLSFIYQCLSYFEV
jgi:hypothetical protein